MISHRLFCAHEHPLYIYIRVRRFLIFNRFVIPRVVPDYNTILVSIITAVYIVKILLIVHVFLISFRCCNEDELYSISCFFRFSPATEIIAMIVELNYQGHFSSETYQLVWNSMLRPKPYRMKLTHAKLCQIKWCLIDYCVNIYKPYITIKNFSIVKQGQNSITSSTSVFRLSITISLNSRRHIHNHIPERDVPPPIGHVALPAAPSFEQIMATVTPEDQVMRAFRKRKLERFSTKMPRLDPESGEIREVDITEANALEISQMAEMLEAPDGKSKWRSKL